MRSRLNSLSIRDFFWVAIPLLCIVFAGFWVTSRFIKPAPPGELTLLSGPHGGAYQQFAASYKSILARYDIKLLEKTTEGALENISLLHDSTNNADAAFFQAGVDDGHNHREGIFSLGKLFYEPLWVFYRGDKKLAQLSQLKGLRIAIGKAGSGVNPLVTQLLNTSGINRENAKWLDIGGIDTIKAFAENKIDVAFLIGPPQSSAVWTLLFTPGIKLMNMAQADGMTRLFPQLNKVVLPRGAVDLQNDRPPQDIALVATTATLLVSEDFHPALVYLMLEAASEVHTRPSIFKRPREFPQGIAVDYPLAEEAERYYKSGKPFLQRYMPFWAATLIDRLVVMLIPVVALLYPLIRIAPFLYGWRVRSRIYQRYGELKYLESEFEANPENKSKAQWLECLDRIEADANRITTPLPFAHMLYQLRSHIEISRLAMIKHEAGKTTDTNS